ncbi:hypothetical protein AB0L59_22345 [Streptomyces sp. NPDC052109]|uniref:hypothetical protein n=1 Tax=Streptomyces sp. NPDC052109 TaxID=3155527 RepID=UPI003437D638
MARTRRIITTAIAAATMLIAAPTATAATPHGKQPVKAAADTCGTSVNPNTYIPSRRRHNGPSAKIGGAKIQVRYGNKKAGAPYYVWASITSARKDDTIHLQWDIDYGSWMDFGTCSATVHSGSAQNTRAVKYRHGNGWHLEAQAWGRHAGRKGSTAYWP